MLAAICPLTISPAWQSLYDSFPTYQEILLDSMLCHEDSLEGALWSNHHELHVKQSNCLNSFGKKDFQKCLVCWWDQITYAEHQSHWHHVFFTSARSELFLYIFSSRVYYSENYCSFWWFLLVWWKLSRWLYWTDTREKYNQQSQLKLHRQNEYRKVE